MNFSRLKSLSLFRGLWLPFCEVQYAGRAACCVSVLCGYIGSLVVSDLYTALKPKASVPGPIGDKNDTVRKTRDGQVCLRSPLPTFSVVVKFYRATPPCCVPVCGVVNYNTTQNSHEAFFFSAAS